MSRKPRVGFICVHNSCRSQIAEALGKLFAEDVFDSYSAGTEVKPHINPDAVRLVKSMYSVDMGKNQKSKLIEDIPRLDIVITMGCNVNCPVLPCLYREDWGLEDPTGNSDEVFYHVIRQIEDKVKSLAERIQKGRIQLYSNE